MQARNLKSAAEFPGVLAEKLRKEVKLGRMAGPFKEKPCADLIVSPLGVVPKKEKGKYRMIQHLSYPRGNSVNDAIDKLDSSVQYQSFDSAVRIVKRLGKGALMAKIDVESAFRLLPLNTVSFNLMGCKFDGDYYIDKCLPMGCSVSCSVFEKFSSFLHWLFTEKTGCESMSHYLDDFLVVGRKETGECRIWKEELEAMFKQLGVPVATEKSEGPGTRLVFLGIMIDSAKGQCELPADKIEKARHMIKTMLKRNKVTLREMQRLLGVLNFACRVIPVGRLFKRRLEMGTKGAKLPEHMVRVNKEMKEDLRVWEAFLDEFNGIRIWEEARSVEELELFTDAAGSAGFGAYLQGRWSAGEWPADWKEKGWIKNMTLLELFPIIVAIELWGHVLENKRIICWSDNKAVVDVMNNLSSSSNPVIKYLRYFVLKCLKHNICFKAQHIPGYRNIVADALSRFKWEIFRKVAPRARKEGEPCPVLLWQIGSK
ncbi:uncharacterized protein LOC128648362 [Bombina bombina]|nr:uncharacterized protein LOC128648362 [Bombina bombina]